MRCPAAPVNVIRPFWPGIEIERLDAGPPGVSEPPASGGTSYSVSVIEPVTLPSGVIRMVYVPVAGSVLVSRKPPVVPAYVVPTAWPFGAWSETWAAENVELVMLRLTRSPDVPLKRSCAVSPGVVVVTVTGGPPGVIGYAAVALPVTVRLADPGVTVKLTAPRVVG